MKLNALIHSLRRSITLSISLIAVSVFGVSTVWGAGSCTLNPASPPAFPGKIFRQTWNWTSDASGDVDDSSCTSKGINGDLLYCETNPDDTAAPTDNYDGVLNNANGTDMMGGAMSDRDTANNELATPLVGAAYAYVRVDGPLSLVISAAGDTMQGSVTCLFESK